MKHTIFYLFVAAAICCIAQACMSNKNAIESHLSGQKSEVTNIKKQTAKQIHLRQQNCANRPAEQTQCGSVPELCGRPYNYCNTPGCLDKIVCCHKIDTTEFNTLTQGGKISSSSFPRSQICELLNGANCEVSPPIHIACDTEAIRCYIHTPWLGLGTPVYRMLKLPTNEATNKPYETFYSVALLSELYNRGLTSIKLFRGTMIDDGDNEINIIPIEVTFPDRVEYYDLSNDFP